MTINQLIKQLNKIVQENDDLGNLQVFSTEQGECRSINSANLMLVNKKDPTKHYSLDFFTLVSTYNSFVKEDYTPAIVLM